jgi:hypothetical protein
MRGPALTVCLYLFGCVSCHAATLTPESEKTLAAEAAKPLVTPAVVKDCKDRLAKAHASSTILRNFTLSPHLAQLVDQHLRVLPGNDNRIVALVVLSSNEGLFGRQMKTIIGCSYRLEDNRLVFRDVHGPGYFPRLLWQ